MTRITSAADRVAAHVADCEAAFVRAARGEFDALVTLVEEFGSVGGLTFFLSVRSVGEIGPLRAFHLKASNPALITFRARNAGSKKRLELTPESFHSLRSIEPLTG